MKSLLASGFEGAHRETLMRDAEMSPATFYRGLEPLLKMGVVVEQRGHYTLPLSHPYNFAFKLWHDQGQLLELPLQLRDEVADLNGKIQDLFGENLLALWVHGSVAQQTMGPESDIDFLAVIRKDQEVDVRGSRPIQLTVLTHKHFKEDFENGDNFLRTILAHGLLVFDRRFAREFYAQPLPAPGGEALQFRQTVQERIKSRLLFFVREDALEDARKALSSLAVSTGRLMLEQLGELPAGKSDLTKALDLYFGPKFSELVATCLAQKVGLNEVFRLQRELLERQGRFATQATYVQGLIKGLSASAQQFENTCQEMLKVVFDNSEVSAHKDTGTDWVLKIGATQVGVCCKSTKGPYNLSQLRALPAFRPLVLIVNQLREVPLMQRPQLGESLKSEAEQMGICVVESSQLLKHVIAEDHDLTLSLRNGLAKNWSRQAKTRRSKRKSGLAQG